MVKINRKWAVVTCLMALLIWGNSLVPGSGSGSLSLTVMEAIRGFLHGVGLPYEWVTNFVVRKCAHFTEYMVLGILATHAFDFEGRRTFDVLLPTPVPMVRYTTSVRPWAQPKVTSPRQATLTSVS